MSNTTTKQKMNYTEDIKEAIKFNYAERCEIKIDNSVSFDLYGDDYVCVFDSSFNNASINLDTDYLTLSGDDNNIKIPLKTISDINYLYDNDCCYLYFCIEQNYDVNICFCKPE